MPARYLHLFTALLICCMPACQKELPLDNQPPAGSGGNTDSTDNNSNGNPDTTVTPVDDNTSYYLRFVVNDIEKDYKAYTKASFPEYIREGAKLYTCQVEAQQNLNGTVNTLYLTVSDTLNIVAGKGYTDKQLYNVYQAVINYNDAFNNIFSSVNYGPESKTNILITEITATYVAGTFSGKVGNVMDSAGVIFPDSSIITNGTFKVKRY